MAFAPVRVSVTAATPEAAELAAPQGQPARVGSTVVSASVADVREAAAGGFVSILPPQQSAPESVIDSGVTTPVAATPAAAGPEATMPLAAPGAPAPTTPVAGDDAKSDATRATHSYPSPDGAVGLTVHADRVALRDGAATEGLTLVRPVTEGVAVYEGPGAAALAGGAGVPVFVFTETDTEAVLLDQAIVGLEPGVAAEAFFAARPEFSGYRPLYGTPDQFVATVAAGPGEAALAAVNGVAGEPGVAFAEPNFYQDLEKHFTPNDPRFTNQWHLNNTGQGGGLVDADSDLPEAWDVNAGGSSKVVIAVVDDGVPTNHPDILNWVNPGDSTIDGVDNDGNGWVDDTNGWNFVGAGGGTRNAEARNAADEHGTSVAGVAAGRGNNGQGVAGASYNSPVMSVRIFDGGSAANADIATALNYAGGRTKDGLGTWKSAEIVNNSWGGGGPSIAINNALTFGTTRGRAGKGTPYFFSSGNGFAAAVSLPASLSSTIPGVISIGSTNNKGERADYSNSGVDLDRVTPSNDARAGYLAIDTTDRVGAPGYDPGDYTGTGANGFGGTSSASRLAAGIGALVLAQADAKGVALTAVQLRSYLRNATDLIGGVAYDLGSGKNLEFGTGRLNAFTAVSGVGKPEISITSPTADLASGTGLVDFGTLFVGSPSKDITLRVRNQGTSALSLGSLSVASGPFSIVTPPAAASLALGEATTLTLRSNPTAFGTFDRTVTLVNGDADEGAFTFTARGRGIVANVSGVAFEDANGNGRREANDAPLAGRALFADFNDNGTRDGLLTFVNATPLPIPDNNTKVTSNLAVSGITGTLTDVDVKLNITHTYDTDLDVFLVAPDGTRVELFTDVGGSGDNFVNTTLDDQAAVGIAAGVAPFTGTFRPEGPLSALNGKPGNGTWGLELADDTPVDTGTLTGWSLELLTAVPERSVTSAANGNAFFDLPAGATAIRVVPGAGEAVTGPASGGYSVTPNGTPLTNRPFGLRDASLPPVATSATNAGAAQRSRVTEMAMTFPTGLSTAVQSNMTHTLTRVRRVDGSADGVTAISSSGSPQQVAVNYSLVGGRTVATLTFVGAGPGVQFGSLADGVWQLAIVSGEALAYVSPTDLSVAGSVYRLFGDVTGDRSVDGFDAAAYDPAFGSAAGDAAFVAAFDYNRDGVLDGFDAAAYDPNFGAFVG